MLCTIIEILSNNCIKHKSVENMTCRSVLLTTVCTRLLARNLKMGVQILSGPKAHLTWRRKRHVSRGGGGGGWGHAPPRKF